MLTGSEYFPGGMGEFVAKKDEFLVFEKGPSVDVVLQWASYRDASDQCSLSRIWGGIHPPADDLPGRKIGEKIGVQAFKHAKSYFNDGVLAGTKEFADLKVYPNPVNHGVVYIEGQVKSIHLFDLMGKEIKVDVLIDQQRKYIKTLGLKSGIYVLDMDGVKRNLLIN